MLFVECMKHSQSQIPNVTFTTFEAVFIYLFLQLKSLFYVNVTCFGFRSGGSSENIFMLEKLTTTFF